MTKGFNDKIILIIDQSFIVKNNIKKFLNFIETRTEDIRMNPVDEESSLYKGEVNYDL